MNSCLYDCEVMHHRLKPKRHRLVHSTFMFYLDLDELDEIAQRLFWVKRNQRGIYSFCDQDHLQFGATDVKNNVRAYLRSKGQNFPTGRIGLLTNLRTFGYLFNPVSFYFCFAVDGQPTCVVPEIGNTFGELKPFFLGAETWQDGMFRQMQTKYFYISPFTDLDIQMDFQLKIPEEKLDIKIDDYQQGEKFLLSSLMGKRLELTDQNLAKLTLRMPWVTVKVISLIHWHALLLWFKKVPYHLKQDHPELQQEVQHVIRKKVHQS